MVQDRIARRNVETSKTRMASGPRRCVPLLVCMACAWVACSSGPTGPVGTGGTITQSVGPSGGTVAMQGATLEIPSGALSANEAISITSTTNAPPPGVTNLSPIYEFGPEGLVFNSPVTVSLTFTPGGVGRPIIVWSTLGGGGFETLTTTTHGTVATASVTHFSEGFVADNSTVGNLPGAASDAGSQDGGPSLDASSTPPADSSSTATVDAAYDATTSSDAAAASDALASQDSALAMADAEAGPEQAPSCGGASTVTACSYPIQPPASGIVYSGGAANGICSSTYTFDQISQSWFGYNDSELSAANVNVTGQPMGCNGAGTCTATLSGSGYAEYAGIGFPLASGAPLNISQYDGFYAWVMGTTTDTRGGGMDGSYNTDSPNVVHLKFVTSADGGDELNGNDFGFYCAIQPNCWTLCQSTFASLTQDQGYGIEASAFDSANVSKVQFEASAYDPPDGGTASISVNFYVDNIAFFAGDAGESSVADAESVADAALDANGEVADSGSNTEDVSLPANEGGPGPIRWGQDVYPTVSPYCVGCHSPATADASAGGGVVYGQLDLSTVDAAYANLVNVPAQGTLPPTEDTGQVACASVGIDAPNGGWFRVAPNDAGGSLLCLRGGFKTRQRAESGDRQVLRRA